jgi:hypothetical protein
MPEDDKNSYLSYKCILTGLFLSPQSYPTKWTPGHFLPDVCPEIHPLMWRPVIFRLSRQLFISNQAEVAKPKKETETEDRSVRHH